MAKRETASPVTPMFPMLKTVEQMSKISGIGENKLRELMDNGELEYAANSQIHFTQLVRRVCIFLTIDRDLLLVAVMCLHELH